MKLQIFILGQESPVIVSGKEAKKVLDIIAISSIRKTDYMFKVVDEATNYITHIRPQYITMIREDD